MPEPAREHISANNLKSGDLIYIPSESGQRAAYVVNCQKPQSPTVAFVGDQDTLAVKQVPFGQIQRQLPGAAAQMSLRPLLDLPFGAYERSDETPESRLGDLRPNHVIPYLFTNTDGSLGLGFAPLKSVQTKNPQTRVKYATPDPHQLVALSGPQGQFNVPYQDSLVLQAVAAKADQLRQERQKVQFIEDVLGKDTYEISLPESCLFQTGETYTLSTFKWVGSVRNHNEDTIVSVPIRDQDTSVYVKSLLMAEFDGMGGHQAGDVASSLAGDIYVKAINNGKSHLDAVQVANTAVYNSATRQGNDSGCTVVSACIQAGSFEIYNAGDSPAFQISKEGVSSKLTIDHSLVQKLIEAGQITEEEALTHPKKSVIYRSVGDKPILELDKPVAGTLNSKEALLLTSDGLLDMLNSPPENGSPHTLETFLQATLASSGKNQISELTSQDFAYQIAILRQAGYQANDNISFVWVTRL